uniref:BHLH transcription factor bHLH3.6 n=1 Tax=Gardenia jasminoides TaxID=114476 RepID=A0A6M4C9B6_GARJA|nr:bHLH transcription factor bHLH3.6 [Gardenia jasminoides]
MDFFDEDISAALGNDFQGSLSSEGNSPSCISYLIPRSSSTTALCNASASAVEVPQPAANLCTSSAIEPPPVGAEIPAKQLKRNRSTPIILTFGNPSTTEISNPQQVSLGGVNPEDDAVSEVLTSHGSFANLEEPTKSGPAPKKGRTRPASQTYDHIIAERKRREQLSQRFVALSAIVPGLKKMDKTSVLGDAITYLKHLKDRVKTLEEQATKQTMQSVVLVKKSQLVVEDEGSSDETGSTDEQRPLPEIEAKLCDKKVLLRVHCQNHRGVLVRVLSEVEKINLAVSNTSVAPFGSLALDITIIAEMDKEFSLTMKELVKSLQSALQRAARDS